MYCLLLRCFAAMAFAWLVITPVSAEGVNSPALTYSPWTKFCLGDTCFTGRDGRSNPDCGSVVSAALIERDGDSRKTLRVTLPNRVNLEHGLRISIDQGRPIERPYTGCFANGCMADYDSGAGLVDQLTQGRMLVLEALDKANSPIRLTVPLADFAGAYEGPPQETKVFEEVQTRLKREIEERRAKCEAR